MISDNSSNRFINWVFCNVVIALFPLISVWIFRSFASQNSINSFSDFPEALFFSLMVCATTISDLRTREPSDKFNIHFLIIELTLLGGVIGSAMIYGVLKFLNILDPTKTLTSTQFYTLLILIIFLVVLSFIGQILLNFVLKAGVAEAHIEEKVNG